MLQAKHNWKPIGTAMEEWLNSNLPEYRAQRQALKDVLIWQDSLKNCAPYFAKRMVMRLYELGAIDVADAEILIKRLGLEAA